VLTRRYVISGRVQGVGFRDFVRGRGEALGIHGWTRNLSNGSVEVVAHGTKEQLDEFSGYLHKGPLWSSVRSVEETEHPLLQSKGFHIKY
jgi:acylphosphatase